MGFVNSISNTTQMIASSIVQNYATVGKAQIACGVFGAAVAVEMAFRAVQNAIAWSKAEPGAVDDVKTDLSANIGGAIFYGVAAANILPGTAVLGAVTFTLYSLFFLDEEDYFLTEVIHKITDKVIIPIVDKVCDCLNPIITAISDVVTAIFKRIDMPETVVWLPATLLIGTIVVVKVVLPSLRL